jgi:phospholipid-binding lipoprotein MlaA
MSQARIRFSRTLSILLLASLVALTGACAHAPPESDVDAYADYERANDPLEPMNKVIFAFNMGLDKVLVRPVAKTYLKVVPRPARRGLGNFIANLMEPFTAANALLQGKPGVASRALSRFLVNSTIGIGGLFDPATKHWGIKQHTEDLGQTFAVWGIPSGPYLMLPFFGPSNLRDATGFAGEILYDPVGMAIDRANVANIGNSDISALTAARISLDALDARARNDELIDELHQTEDAYTLARSAYRQNRLFDISDGKVVSTEEDEDMFEDFDEEFEDYGGEEEGEENR